MGSFLKAYPQGFGDSLVEARGETYSSFNGLVKEWEDLGDDFNITREGRLDEMTEWFRLNVGPFA